MPVATVTFLRRTGRLGLHSFGERSLEERSFPLQLPTDSRQPTFRPTRLLIGVLSIALVVSACGGGDVSADVTASTSIESTITEPPPSTTSTAVTSSTAGTSTSAAESGATVLAIGDSVFAANAGQNASIPDFIGEALGVSVENRARGGAYFSTVGTQYEKGEWEWVVIIGGGNDLGGTCECGECGSVLDGLVAADGTTGEIPELVRSIASDGTEVMLVGYYDVHTDAGSGFDRCRNDIEELRARMDQTANVTDAVWFVSAADVISTDDNDAYASDRVHPSPVGAELIGEYVAAAIQATESS